MCSWPMLELWHGCFFGCSGASHTQWERMTITYLIGRLFFEQIPKAYIQGTDLVGKVSWIVVQHHTRLFKVYCILIDSGFFCSQVKAVNYLGQPIPNLLVYLFAGRKGSPCIVDTITTDQSGIGSFSLETEKLSGEVYLYVSIKKLQTMFEHPKRVWITHLNLLLLYISSIIFCINRQAAQTAWSTLDLAFLTMKLECSKFMSPVLVPLHVAFSEFFQITHLCAATEMKRSQFSIV